MAGGDRGRRRGSSRPPFNRALHGLLALAVALAVAVLAAAPPAGAHGTLTMSTPADGATVTEPLAAVELYFTEKVAANAYLTIHAPGGGRVDDGWTHGSPKPLDKPVREYVMVDGKFEPREYTTGFPAVVRVAHLPAAGLYSVRYLSVASDGEAVRGAMSFWYKGKATPAPQGWRPPTDQADPALVAAAEQHGTPAPSTPSATGSAAATGSDEEGGPGWVAWSGWAVALAAAVAGWLGWRRRAAPDGGPAGRRASRSAPRQRGGGARPAGKGGGTAGGAGSGTTRKAAAAGPAKAAGGGKGRKAVVPAERKDATVVTARTPVTAEDESQAEIVDNARSSNVDDPGAAPPLGGGGLSNTRLALLAGGLIVALLVGFGLGRLGTGADRTTAGGPPPAGGPASPGGAVSAGDGHQHPAGTGAHGHPGDGSAGEAQATGTTVSARGYTLQPVRRAQPAGNTVEYKFRIVGADRKAATQFVAVHDKPLHMIVVGRDLSGYQHLHPTMAPDGTWSVLLTLARPGGYRIYADFSVTATDGTQLPLVLGVDHHVPGAHTQAALPPAAPQATAGPFAVSMQGTPTVGVAAPMFFRVSRTGAPGPSQLERYLGAYGHLVVIREGDLGYVHVHPEAELVDGAVKFWLTAPSAGRYRAFFDFQVAGNVHTAQYTLDIS
jgi:methionine-rich copper-binding protein CopC